MAMEMTPPKRLGRHSLPIIMVAVSGLVLSVLALSQYGVLDSQNSGNLGKSLVTRMLRVQPKPDGLAKVSFGRPQASGQASDVGAYLGSGPESAGQTANLLFNLRAGN